MTDENTRPQDEKATEAVPEAISDQAAPEAPKEEETPATESEASTEETASEKTSDEETPKLDPTQAYKDKLSGMDRLKAGQTVRLHERIKDVSSKGEQRERIQVFEGMLMAMGGSGISRTVTLRKISGSVAVEKIYPINSPVVAKIELVKSAKVRQAKLGYLKNPKRRFKRKLKETYTELGKQKKKRKEGTNIKKHDL